MPKYLTDIRWKSATCSRKDSGNTRQLRALTSTSETRVLLFQGRGATGGLLQAGGPHSVNPPDYSMRSLSDPAMRTMARLALHCRTFRSRS